MKAAPSRHDEADEHSMEVNHHEQEVAPTGGVDPTKFICYPVAVFLICSGIMAKSRYRVLASCIFLFLPFSCPSTTFVTAFVPFFIVSIAAWEKRKNEEIMSRN